jgi:hypothetical protein
VSSENPNFLSPIFFDTLMNISVIYCPQPDEQEDISAACEYATHILNIINERYPERTTAPLAWNCACHKLELDSLQFITQVQRSEVTDCSNLSPSLCILLISCSADGSVHSTARKLARTLKNAQSPITHAKSSIDLIPSTENSINRPNNQIAIALLGHARCENSAQQMKDTIFNSGRKLYKSIQHSIRMGRKDFESNCFSWYLSEDRLELQVELEGPDAPGGFNEWVVKILDS